MSVAEWSGSLVEWERELCSWKARLGRRQLRETGVLAGVVVRPPGFKAIQRSTMLIGVQPARRPIRPARPGQTIQASIRPTARVHPAPGGVKSTAEMPPQRGLVESAWRWRSIS